MRLDELLNLIDEESESFINEKTSVRNKPVEYQAFLLWLDHFKGREMKSRDNARLKSALEDSDGFEEANKIVKKLDKEEYRGYDLYWEKYQELRNEFEKVKDKMIGKFTNLGLIEKE